MTSKECVKCHRIKWWYQFYTVKRKHTVEIGSYCIECAKKNIRLPDSVRAERKRELDETLKINQLSETDAAYIAGFLDGEGSICLHLCNKHNPSKLPKYHLKIRITNTFPGIMEWIALTVGHGNIYTKKKYPKSNKQAWEWQIAGRRAINFLEQLYPYLRVKRLQADVAFQFGETISPPGRNELPNNVIQFRDHLRKQLSVLNH